MKSLTEFSESRIFSEALTIPSGNSIDFNRLAKASNLDTKTIKANLANAKTAHGTPVTGNFKKDVKNIVDFFERNGLTVSGVYIDTQNFDNEVFFEFSNIQEDYAAIMLLDYEEMFNSMNGEFNEFRFSISTPDGEQLDTKNIIKDLKKYVTKGSGSKIATKFVATSVMADRVIDVLEDYSWFENLSAQEIKGIHAAIKSALKTPKNEKELAAIIYPLLDAQTQEEIPIRELELIILKVIQGKV